MRPPRLFRLTYQDFVMAAEVAALVLPVELALRRTSLGALIARFGRTDRIRRGGREIVDVGRAARLVDAVAGCYPNITCLKKSLILLRLLRKRGIAAELRLGVRKVDDDFTAHAWIEYSGRTLLDGGTAHLYSTLPLPPA
jgi:Transglutaminase-like superfamily